MGHAGGCGSVECWNSDAPLPVRPTGDAKRVRPVDRPVSLSWQRFKPTNLRLTSALARFDLIGGRRFFLKPADADDVPYEPRPWDNRGSGDCLQRGGVQTVACAHRAGWDVQSVQDLRSLSATLNEIAARRERRHVAGGGPGRNVDARCRRPLCCSPRWTGIRPRASLGSTFGMVRDPNNRSLVVTSGLSAEPVPRLARRTGNTQYVMAAANVDPARGLQGWLGDASPWMRLARVMRPVDLWFRVTSWRRTMGCR